MSLLIFEIFYAFIIIYLLIFEVFSADLSFFSNPIINLTYLCVFRGPTNLIKEDIELRNHKNMQYYYNNNERQKVSIESVPNIF